jgi:hypothetical protein
LAEITEEARVLRAPQARLIGEGEVAEIVSGDAAVLQERRKLPPDPPYGKIARSVKRLTHLS